LTCYNQSMPSKNTIKIFEHGGYYHVYNRGVNKSIIFRDEVDYAAFIRRLQLMLFPPQKAAKLQHTSSRIRINNYYGEVQLLAFCLMPNHFHMILGQNKVDGITEFMRTLCTSYSMYFNLRHKRIGPLYQGRFKAATISDDAYFIHLSRYVHNNPIHLTSDIFTYEYSSLQYYFNDTNQPEWLKTDIVEQQFKNKTEYYEFIKNMPEIKKEEKQYSLD